MTPEQERLELLSGTLEHLAALVAAQTKDLTQAAEFIARNGKGMADLASATAGNSEMLVELAKQSSDFMATTRRTLELLAERIDDVAKAQGRVPPAETGPKEHELN